VTIFIRRGRYEEIVYFRHKANLTFEGEDRAGVVIGYANNELFNGPPTGVPTNEKPGTFPYRRAAFAVDRSTGIRVTNLTIANFTPRGGSQAEALLLSGGQHIVSRVTLTGHQDTLQVNDAAYIEDSDIEGDTDFLWGRGPAYFTRTTLRQLSATSPFMWCAVRIGQSRLRLRRLPVRNACVASGAPSSRATPRTIRTARSC
jgi:pectin methylesterase-like acyl-CoA thioesterase